MKCDCPTQWSVRFVTKIPLRERTQALKRVGRRFSYSNLPTSFGLIALSKRQLDVLGTSHMKSGFMAVRFSSDTRAT